MKAFLIFIALPALGICQEKIDKKYFENLLAKKEFNRVFMEGNELLNKPYGKTSPLTYYYIGRSLCGRGYDKQGKEWFRYVKEQLPLEKDFNDELTVAEKNCTSGGTAPAPRVVNITINTSYTPAQPGGIRGKGGFILGCDKDVNENYDNLRKNDSLYKRLFTTGQKDAAISYLRTFLTSQYNIDISGRFLVVSLSRSGYYHEDVITVTKKLEFAYQFFVKKYQLSETDKLFTVYLLPDRYMLRKAAKDVHDIKLSEANIGYSSLNDLSLLGISNPNSVGTLFHELFHLVIRSDVGDISPWLDEGMACLYSVYKTKNTEIEGAYDTWRVAHFKLLMNLKPSDRVAVPSLEQLINYNWLEYQGGETNNLCIGSVNYALSNLFVLYLQSKGLLPQIVETFKNRRAFSTDSLLPGPGDTKLLELVLKNDLATISSDFYNWLKQSYNIDMPKLLKKRPFTNALEMPADMQPVVDTINTLIAQIEKTPGLGGELKKIKSEKEALLSTIMSYHGSFMRRQSEKLEELADRDMDANVNMNNEGIYQKYMKERMEELNLFKERLRKIVGKEVAVKARFQTNALS